LTKRKYAMFVTSAKLQR